MKKIRNILCIVAFATIISGLTLKMINHGNMLSHVGRRNVDEHLENHEVLDIVYSYLGISSHDVSNLNVELNDDSYDVSFDVDDVTYYFEVHSTTGKILELNQENN